MPKRAPKLTVRIETFPDPHYEERRQEALNLLADGLADIFIAQARAEVAAELGKDPDELLPPSPGVFDDEDVRQLRDPTRKRRR